MKLDTTEQRDMLLGILESINVPGKALEQVYDLKRAIRDAEIMEPDKPGPKGK